MAWNDLKRFRIEIDSSKIGSTLTDFPIALHISSVAGQGSTDLTPIFDELGSNNQRIAVYYGGTQYTGSQCYIEIEHWNTTTEEAVLHIKVPSVSNSTDTVLYLYYDNSQADNTIYVGNTGDTAAKSVWDDYFVLVHHCNASDPSVTSNIIDSKFGTQAVVTEIEADDATTGYIGLAYDFDNEWILWEDADKFSPSGGELTVECVFSSDDVPPANGDGLVGKYIGSGSNNREYALTINPTGYLEWTLSPNGTSTGLTSAIDPDIMIEGTWYYGVGTWNGSTTNQTLRKNDSQVDDNTSAVSSITNLAARVALGNNYERSSSYSLDGQIAEARISMTERSSDWLDATYYTLFDTLLNITNVSEHTIYSDYIDEDLENFPVTLSLDTTNAPSGFWEYFDTVVPEDNFKGTNGSLPNQTRWTDATTTGFSSTILNNKLRQACTLGSGGANTTRYKLSGDFDIQIDFDAITYPDVGGWRSGIQVYIDSTHYFWVDKYRSTALRIRTWYDDGGGITNNYTEISNPLTGKFRIVRTGSSYQGYIEKGSGWYALGGAVTTIGTGDVYVRLGGDSYSANPDYTMDFDNFHINYADAIVWDDTQWKSPNDDFTGNDGDTEDNNLWQLGQTTGSPAPSILSNKLRMTGNSTAQGRIISTFQLVGDFDVKVDFDLITYPATVGWSSSLRVFDDSTGYSMQESRRYNGNNVYQSQYYNGTWNSIDQDLTTDLSGKLRIARSGSTTTFYYWSSTTASWVSQGTDSTTIGTNDIRVFLLQERWTNNPTSVSDFDNFSVIYADGITWNNYKDRLYFTDSNESKLHAEIETFDTATSAATYHIVVPSVSSTSNTPIVLNWNWEGSSYSNWTGTVGTTAAQAVWDANYMSVYHLVQDPTGGAGAILNSTANSRDGTAYNMEAGDLVDAPPGKGLSFDGVNEQVTCGDYDDPSTGALTAEAHFKRNDTATNAQAIIGKGNQLSTDEGWAIFMEDGNLNARCNDGSSRARQVGTAPNETTSYHHVALALDRATNEILGFLDGENSVFSFDPYWSNDISGFDIDTSQELSFASLRDFPSSTTAWGNITLTEVRISNIRRSDAWIKATYNSLIGNIWNELITYTESGSATYTAYADYVDSNLSWFPVTLSLGTIATPAPYGFWNSLTPSGTGVYFTDSNGNKLFSEIETFDASTSAATYHVAIPTLSSTSNTPITMNWNWEDGRTYDVRELSTSYVTDYFTGNNQLPNTTIWTEDGGTNYFTINNNTLHASGSNINKWLRSTYHLGGDFDIELNWSCSNPNTSEWRIGLWVTQEGDDGNTDYMAIYRMYDGTHRIYSNYKDGDAWGSFSQYLTSVTSGNFRIVRVGNIVYAYYDVGSGDTLLKSRTFAEANPVQVIIEAVSITGNPEIHNTYDNFVVNSADTIFFLEDVSDDFTGSNGDPPNPLKWRIDEGSPDIQNNKLQFDVSNANQNEEVQARYRISGDFDIQVDYELTVYPSTQRWHFGLSTELANGHYNRINREYNTAYSPANRYRNAVYDGAFKTNGTVATTDLSGKLRMVRVGSTFTSYYWDGTAWQSVANFTDITTTEDVIVELTGGSVNNYPTAQNNWDNFQVNSAGSITGWTGETTSVPAQQLWDNNFVGVYHMHDDPTGTLEESTILGLDGAPANMESEDLVDGLMGKAYNFDGSNECVTVSYNSAQAPTSALSVEVFAHKTDWTGTSRNEKLVSKTEVGGYNIERNQTSGITSFVVRRNGAYGYGSISNTSIPAGWNYFLGKYDGRYATLFINDGTLSDTDDAGGSYAIQYNNSNALQIAAEAGTGAGPVGNYLLGQIAEVRLSNTARSDTWGKATYYSLNGDIWIPLGADEWTLTIQSLTSLTSTDNISFYDFLLAIQDITSATSISTDIWLVVWLIIQNLTSDTSVDHADPTVGIGTLSINDLTVETILRVMQFWAPLKTINTTVEFRTLLRTLLSRTPKRTLDSKTLERTLKQIKGLGHFYDNP